VTSALIAIPVTGLAEGEVMLVAEASLQEDSVPVGRYRPADVVLVMAVRFAPNIGGVLKEVIELEGIVVLGLEAVDSMLRLNAVVFK
jgi:hypothetical protein